VALKKILSDNNFPQKNHCRQQLVDFSRPISYCSRYVYTKSADRHHGEKHISTGGKTSIFYGRTSYDIMGLVKRIYGKLIRFMMIILLARALAGSNGWNRQWEIPEAKR
jgi:hypothetical protein